MNKLDINIGIWKNNGIHVVSERLKDNMPHYPGPGTIVCKIPPYWHNKVRWEDNAKLICDAGNTYQKCGLLPSELLKQRDELLQTLQQIERGVTGLPLQALQTIDSIEKQENETK